MKKQFIFIFLIGISMTYFAGNAEAKGSTHTFIDSPGQTVSDAGEQKQPKEGRPQPAQSSSNKTQENASTNKNENEPFNYLEKLAIREKGPGIKYNPSYAEVFDETIRDLPESDPFHHSKMNYFSFGFKLLKTPISSSGEDYYVLYSSGPSADPTFYFFKDGAFKKPAFRLSAMNVYIPGNGNIYTSGHTNNLFNTRKKFQLKNGELVEAGQPFYYVGLESKLLKPAKLYKTRELSEVVATLPAQYPVEVVINKPGTRLFLLKTNFGLTGWLEVEDVMYSDQLIEGLYLAGD